MSTTAATFFPSEIWRRALRDSDIDARAKTLGLWMSVYADHVTGEMFPAIATLQLLIVNEEGKPFSRSTIQRMRALLVENDWIALDTKGYRGQPSIYRLRLPTGLESASETPSESASRPLPESASGQMHQVQQEVYIDQELEKGFSAKGEIEEANPHPFADSTCNEQKSRQVSGSTSRVNPVNPFAAKSTISAVQPPTTATTTADEERLREQWRVAFRGYYGREPNIGDVGDFTLDWFRCDTLRLREMAELPWMKDGATG